MRLPRPIQHGLLAVAVLGVLTSGIALLALNRAVVSSQSLRLDHARESTVEELKRLADAADAHAPPPNIVGMRGGTAASAAEVSAGIPPSWAPALATLAARAVREGGEVSLEAPLPDAQLIARVRRVPGGRLAWVAVAVRPSPYLQSWRVLVAATTLLTLLLVGSAVSALVTVKRGAGALLNATRALAVDLSAPVPRPPVRELAAIGDGIASLAHHLAESRQAQERLSRDLAQQERLAALGRVVAGVAHEVRNPLASIKLRLDLAASPTAGVALPPAVSNAIAHASSEIVRLDGLVADLLTLSGRALGTRTALDLGDLARRRADALGPWAALRRVSVRVDAPAPALATGDPDRLARAVDNLLRNAVEASPDGDVVEVKLKDADAGGQFRLDVLDRGPGLAEARAAQLFEPFFTTKPDGTGLGLAITRAIARAHGGDVRYAREGDVTHFELRLPREATPERNVDAGPPV